MVNKFTLQRHRFTKDSDYTIVGLQLQSTEVQAQSRRMRVTWSPQMAQDLEAFQGLNMEAELTAMLSEEISNEIDREILNSLRTNIGGENHEFNHIHFPIVERVAAQTVGLDLVAVQPMSLPVGNLFYFTPEINQIQEPIVNKDGSWSVGNKFGSTLINWELKPHELKKKKKNPLRPNIMSSFTFSNNENEGDLDEELDGLLNPMTHLR